MDKISQTITALLPRERIRAPNQLRRWANACNGQCIWRGVASYLLLTPLLPILAQLLTLVAAAGLSTGTSFVRVTLLPHLPLDPVYASAAIYLVGDIDPHGIAISGSLGHLLHGWLPTLFASESLVSPGTIATALLESGGTVLAGTLARVAAAVLLVTSFQLVSRMRRNPNWFRLALLLAQIHVLIDLVPDVALKQSEIEAAGIPFLVASFLPVAGGGQRSFFTAHLDTVPEPLISAISGIVLAVLVFILSSALSAGLRLLPHGAARVTAASHIRPSISWSNRGAMVARCAASIALVTFVTASPLGAIADSEMRVLDTPSALPLDISREPIAAPVLQNARTASSTVEVERTDAGFALLVNGEPTVIKGIGYNPWYADQDASARNALYDRDFQRIHASGANMLEGWFESQFDEVTLDAAQRNGLGVIMPFEMNQDYDYRDPATQERFIQDISSWVIRYRQHPAVRIWAPANEMMHRLLYPTLVRGSIDPMQEQRASRFADFYVRVIDTIHGLDPAHPVLYRDAEDGYLDRLRIALQQDGVARPWFIYGANAYTPRIAQIVKDWPEHGLDAPLMFSEFSPSGVAGPDRAQRFKWYWSVIRSNPNLVLGGVVYTWCTGGPEDLDRVFGLTTPAGDPVDGSVAMLHRLFITDQSESLEAHLP